MINTAIETILVNNQLTIPQRLLKILGIIPNGKVVMGVKIEQRQLIVRPVENLIDELYGSLAGKLTKNIVDIKKSIRKEEAIYE